MIRAYRATLVANQVHLRKDEPELREGFHLDLCPVPIKQRTSFCIGEVKLFFLTIGPMLMMFSSFGQTSMATSHDTWITR